MLFRSVTIVTKITLRKTIKKSSASTSTKVTAATQAA